MLTLIQHAPNNAVSHERAIGSYVRHLTTEMMNWENKMCLPAKIAISKAMQTTDKKLGQQFLAEKIIADTIKKGNQVFWWSDQHFFHHNIIEYAKRPFHNVDHMHEEMINRYNSIVTDQDVVVFGGDFAFGPVEKAREILSSLRGRKILVLGNHDFDKKGMLFRQYHHFEAACMQMLFWRADPNDPNQGHYLLATHYPIRSAYLPPNTLNIHGHIHQHSASVRHTNMSVEHVNYQPQTIDALIPIQEAYQRLAEKRTPDVDNHASQLKK